MKLRVCSPSPQISISAAAAQYRLDDLAAYRRWRLLAPAIVGANGAVDIVVARQTRDDPEVLGEVPAHPFAEQLLPPVAILGHRGVRVRFTEGAGWAAVVCFSAA